ncbi:helix-turn-helix transcriptional regulator [Paenibacillus sp. FSL L8-0638]|uniref:helix-turn-helix transcriptional regulator n=1 Tax=Paenibacillus TaxID=44249 RepID=UPI003158FDD0
MSNDNSKSKTLGAFLKSRRNRLQPEQAGLRLSQGQRRTPGLRREEVAMLAGVSATYYTWLEQGREVTASKEIIESIGEALQLTHDERAHLIQLWNPNEAVAISPIQTRLNPQWQHIIDQLSYPSFISNEKAEVLAWNSAANEVITDFSSLSVSERVMIRLLFVDSELRRRMVNWEEFASYSVAVFRTYYDKYLGDPWFEETVERLRVESMEFDTMWKQHHIQLKKVNRVSLQIPGAVEAVSYDINSLASITDQPGLHFCIYTPVSQSSTW